MCKFPLKAALNLFVPTPRHPHLVLEERQLLEEVSRARFRDPAAAGELDADQVEGPHRDGEDQTEVVSAGVAVQRVVRDEPAEEEGEVLHGRRLVPPLRTADDDALPLGNISHHVA